MNAVPFFPLYVESFGTPDHVKRELAQRIPLAFPEQAVELVEHTQNLVDHYARTEKWDLVSISVSSGLAREMLNELLSTPVEAAGRIVIDPTASTPEHKVYGSAQVLQAACERLILINEQTGDSLITLYGLERRHRTLASDLLMRRLRMIGAVLALIPREELELNNTKAFTLLLLAQKRLLRALRAAGLMMGLLFAAGVSADDDDGLRHIEAFEDTLAVLHLNIAALLQHGVSGDLGLALETLLHDLRAIPADLRAVTDLNFDLGDLAPLLDVTMTTVSPAEPDLLPSVVASAPELHHR